MSQQINLYNPQLFPRRDWLAASTIMQFVLVAGLLGVLGGGILAVEVYASGKRLAVIGQAVAQQENAVKAWQSKLHPRQPDAALVEQVQQRANAVDRMSRGLRLLEQGGLGESKGFSPFMQAFARETMDGVWLTGFTIGEDGEFELKGRTLKANSVSAFLARLQQEKVLSGKKIEGFRLWRGQEQGAKEAEAAPRPLPYLDFVARSTPLKSAAATNSGVGQNGG